MNGEQRMPPWKEITYFQNPVVTIHSFAAANAWELVAPANPNRVVLQLATSPGPAGIFFTTDPTTTPATGLVQNQGINPMTIREADDGILCTTAWYGSVAQLPGTAFIQEVILREWPQQGQKG